MTLTGTDVSGNPVSRTVQTDGQGRYTVAGLLPSDSAGYRVVKTPPAGFIDNPQTVGTVGGAADGRLPGSGFNEIDAVLLAAGEAGVGFNFGEVVPSSLAGVVYADPNDNGVFEPGAPDNEQGLSGVTVTLSGLDDMGQTVSKMTTTGPGGAYSFTSLRPGRPGRLHADGDGARGLPAGHRLHGGGRGQPAHRRRRGDAHALGGPAGPGGRWHRV